MVEKNNRVVIRNRKALHDFSIEKSFEAGIKLRGSEIKSVRASKANLKGSFARVENGELFLYNMHISPYKFSQEDYDPVRKRKLLLHRREIHQLEVGVSQKGFAIVPIKVYIKRGYAKVELALAKGKKHYDKRRDIKEKEAKKRIQQAMRNNS